MAFSRGQESVANGGIKRYVGVGLFKCHGVNLSNKELSELYGHEIESAERSFVTEVDLNGVKTKRVSLNFTLSTEIDGKREFFNARYSLLDATRVGSNSGKSQIMDQYGRTAWITDAEFDARAIPQYASGPANITNNYRKLYTGEEYLTRNNGKEIGFLVALLNIPNVTKFVDGKPAGLVDNPADSECRLENVSKLFDGDFSEIREILSYQPENELKLMVGVRKDDQNRLWQDFFIEFPMRASTRNYNNLHDALVDAKNNGRYPNTDFGNLDAISDIAEYVESPTTIAPTATGAAPANPWFKKPQA